ncbi:MAG: ATP-binding protein [Bacteroidia bacterium]
MLRSLFICILSFTGLIGHGWAQDTSSINSLINRCYSWQYEAPDSILMLAPGALVASKAIHFQPGIAKSNFIMGHAHYEMHQYDSAIMYMQEAIGHFQGKRFFANIAAAYNITGVCYKNLADYTRALNAQLAAISLFEEINDTAGIVISYNNLGILYNDQKKLQEAETWFWKGLKLAEQGQNPYLLVTSQSNMAMNLHSQERYSESLDIFRKVLQFDLLDGNEYEIGASYNNVASSLLKLDRLDSALYYIDSSIYYKEISGDRFGMVTSLTNKAQAYMQKNMPRLAINTLDTAIQIAESIQAKKLQSEIFLKYHQNYELLGISDSALYYYKRFHQLSDSLLNQETELALANVRRQYDLEKVDQELSKKNLEIKNIKEIQRFYLFGFLTIMVIAFMAMLGFFRFRKLNKVLRQNEIDLKNTNLILQRVNEQLEQARDEAESANKAKSAFLSNVSHEIRTPLNAILGMLDLIHETLKKNNQERVVETIRHSANSLLHIINDLLDLSKIEAGKISFEHKSFNLTSLMQQLELSLNSLATDKGLHIITEIDPEIPDFLTGDQFRLNQILLNLGGNAVKFTPEGSIKISVNRLDSETDNEQCQLLFEVKDTGIGISDEQIQRIFQRFSQADENISRKYGGTGLGLAISKKLVELQGGKIGVNSVTTQGSNFWFELKFKISESQDVVTTVVDLADDDRLKGMRALVIDDNVLNVKLAAQILNRWEVQAITALSGKEALEYLRKGERFDFVLLDIHMPEMNGFETHNRMVRDYKLNCPVIALTADTYEETMQQIREAGIAAVVIKPYRPAELKKTLFQFLKAY